MLINLRGTSGSGKSTIIRRVMDLYTTKTRVKVKERTQPIGYFLSTPGHRQLAVLGHYETDCGGCDTIMSLDEIYANVRWAADHGNDVLFEGLLISAEVNRTTALATDNYPFLVIGLETPIDECIASVNTRRSNAFQRRLERVEAMNLVKAEKGHKLLPIPEPRGDVNPRNTESKFKATETTMRRLAENGVQTEWHTRESAFLRIREVLDI